MHTGPKLTNDNLVFGYDTGYGVADNAVTTRFYQGEPTETFSIGSMLPTDPTASFVSNSTYHSNLAGSAWDWSYYPNSNISSDGGMEWRPEIQGPTFTGAWLMKKRAGGNGESNFSGTAPGSITSSAAYTVSVWVKTDQASCFRIHLNTTKNGSSYWGYASSYHSGGNEWERLSLNLPANSGNTAINTIRFQAVGSSVNADAYCRDYQVEKRGQATPFILGGTRSDTASLIDLKKTRDVDVSNMSFDSDGQPELDGTDDDIDLGSDITFKENGGDWTVESIVKYDSVPASYNNSTAPGNFIGAEGISFNSWYWSVLSSKLALWNISPGVWKYGSTTLTANKFYHVVLTCSPGGTQYKMYLNGVQEGGTHADYTFNASYSGLKVRYFGRGNVSNPRLVNGKISVTKIYDTALTSAQIADNFNAYKNRFDL